MNSVFTGLNYMFYYFSRQYATFLLLILISSTMLGRNCERDIATSDLCSITDTEIFGGQLYINSSKVFQYIYQHRFSEVQQKICIWGVNGSQLRCGSSIPIGNPLFNTSFGEGVLASFHGETPWDLIYIKSF